MSLRDYQQIQTALFVKMIVEEYRVNPEDTPTTQSLLFSSFNRPVTIDGDVFLPLGNLLGISSSSSDIRLSEEELTITISGVPLTSIPEIINSGIKGSSIQIWRVFFDITTGDLLDIPNNPASKFRGLVNNYSIEEDFTPGSQTTTNTILLSCASSVAILANKVSGRRTNPIDQKALYPFDVSMDRVNTLANSNFNFGAVIR